MEPGPTTSADPGDASTRRVTRGLARRDEASYAEFFEAYFDRIFRLILVLLRGDEATARDLAQATLLKVVRHARPFDSARDFWNWLARLARTTVIDHLRRQKSRVTLLPIDEGRDHPGEPPDGEAEWLEALRESLADLEPQDRALVESIYLDRAPRDQIATGAGLTIKAVENRLRRLREKLRQSILKRLSSHELT